MVNLHSLRVIDGLVHVTNRDEYVAPIPEPERHDMVLAYHAQLNSADDEVRITAAKAWAKWEMSTSKLYGTNTNSLLYISRDLISFLVVDPEHIARAESDEFAK